MSATELPDFTIPPAPYSNPGLRLLRQYFQPRFIGMENIEQGPSLFVGNHSRFALYDMGLLQSEVYNQKGIWLRGLADHVHFTFAPWARLLEARGAIHGTRELCSLAMQRGDNLLVFPGGAREVMKRKGEDNALIWKQRLGFVKMAAKHKYPIQPYSSVGPDHVYSILVDAADIERSRLRPLLERLPLWAATKNGEEFPPLARGIGPTLLPRPEPFQFCFGPAIETASYHDDVNDDAAMTELRDKVRAAVQNLIEQAQAERAALPPGPLWRRVLRKL